MEDGRFGKRARCRAVQDLRGGARAEALLRRLRRRQAGQLSAVPRDHRRRLPGAQGRLPEMVRVDQAGLGTGGADRNRTDVRGFAGRCMTTLPPRRTRETGETGYRRFPPRMLERQKSLELSTSTLARLRSTN